MKMNKPRRNSIRLSCVTCLIIASVAGFNLLASAMPVQSQNTSRQNAMSRAEGDRENDPMAMLASARVIYVYSRTMFVKAEVIENELRKRDDFQSSGLLLTKNPSAADLTIEVRRSNFTTEYPYVVVDSKTQYIVASGRVNSLFGTAAGKIAKGFMKQLQKARAAGSN
jgi:hypothetical protein